MLGAVELARIALTTSCRDTDRLPKVPGAGSIVDGAQLMHNGVRIEAGSYHGEWMTEVIRNLRGHHEPQEEVAYAVILDALRGTANASPCVVELGSFWAYYALWFLHEFPNGRALLIEPDPDYLKVGRRNFALNDREGTFYEACIGPVNRTEMEFPCESDGQIRQVEVVTLDRLIEMFNLDLIDVLLADIQGGETALLTEGAGAFEAGLVRFVVISTHHHVISNDPETHQKCLQRLTELGAHIIVEHSVAESYSGDGLIVASFDDRDANLTVEVSRARASESLFGDPVHDLARAWQESQSLAAENRSLEERFAQLDRDRQGLDAEMQRIRATRTWQLRTRALRLLRKL
jgi:FkbM family methyltransferase